ncbi:periplasmic heavy metal sensor [Azospirillum melinis]|uniref:Periplasmic heavy metal sensor n=1 Tax=Azospirillum melinis TaxID=328839 RepID=A0ABX2KMM9_9PROT|nr:periplasmic heavy metal sensor [Azospirillum melinis]MBP2309966.1 putative membrane protein [Azospirillum melinis]NUB02741.1 periplasmic heavy metal sensor [Azospirillum melinis]
MNGLVAPRRPQPSLLTRLRQGMSLRRLALLSLALNLFLAAMLVGTTGKPAPPPYRPMPDRFVEHVAAGMSDADAARLRAIFEPLRPRYDALTEDYREEGQRVRSLLQAEPVDFESLNAAIAAARAKRRLIGELTEQTVLLVLPDLSPAGRLRMVGGWGTAGAPVAPKK